LTADTHFTVSRKAEGCIYVTVTHLTTNQAQRRATSMIGPNALHLHHARCHQPPTTTTTMTAAITILLPLVILVQGPTTTDGHPSNY